MITRSCGYWTTGDRCCSRSRATGMRRRHRAECRWRGGTGGVALREGVPIRIGHMARMYRYGRTLLEQPRAWGSRRRCAGRFRCPGWRRPAAACSALRARGRSVGVLLVESESDSSSATTTRMRSRCCCAARPGPGHAAARGADTAGRHGRSRGGCRGGGVEGPALRIRHFARDDSVFIDDAYLIKGVAGAILWKVVNEAVNTGRTAFTSRELRLAGARLRLPDVQDNLAVRLLLLRAGCRLGRPAADPAHRPRQYSC